MKYILSALVLAASPLAAADCPPAPDITPALDPLHAALAEAPDEATARALSADLWALWTKAPDAAAQDMLDLGMERRSAYDFEAAYAVLTELIAYCPDYAEGYNQRAFVSFLRHDYGAALEDIEEALARRPRHVGAMSGKALTLMGLGRMKAAQGVLREAVSLNPWLQERALLIEAPGTDL